MHYKHRLSFQFLLLMVIIGLTSADFIKAQSEKSPLKVGIIGLTHSHVHWILGRPDQGDIQVVGIVEPNIDLASRYADQYGYSMNLVYDNMDEMLASTKPEAVTAFGSIYDHLQVVESCAPKGIHVMVEKPLAISLKHARRMEQLAQKHDIYLLTNYETTWYASNHKAKEMITAQKIGAIRKIVVHDGHPGPAEIGINKEFLDWLTDPKQNGAGALTDFGCYGANLITWLMNGQRPLAVTAVAQTIKPHLYPKVDDEATIILQYPKTQGIIQASWNWPISRKDMAVYGKTGQLFCDNRSDFRYQLDEKQKEAFIKLPERPTPLNDPFAMFSSLIRNEITLESYDLSSLENNLVVVEILEAAIKSAKKGRAIKLK